MGEDDDSKSNERPRDRDSSPLRHRRNNGSPFRGGCNRQRDDFFMDNLMMSSMLRQRDMDFRLNQLQQQYPTLIRAEEIGRWRENNYQQNFTENAGFIQEMRARAERSSSSGGASSFGGGSSGGGGGGSW